MKPTRKVDLAHLLGRRISELRHAKGLSQSALGQLVGATKMRIYRVEKGYVPVLAVELAAIADALGHRVARFYKE